ncbi:MAG: ABC transporter substrate-binding protein [Dehalococcoidaceae bacterium]|nr:ABC transporter substrate-binding protein [Dehalococcoidaceae bacterium]
MGKIKWLAVVLSLAMIGASLPLASCTGGGGEKVLNMYVAYGNPEIVAEAFEEETGIKVNFLPMSSGEVLTRIKAESANPQTDIWFGGGSDAFLQAKEEGLIQAYASPNAANVDEYFKDADGYWTAVSIVVVGFVVNTDRVASKGLDIPETWEDLIAPGFNDEISSPDPNISGTAYTMVSGILQIMGEQAGWEFLDKLFANIDYLEKSGSTPPSKALQGEYCLGVAPDPHITIMNNPGAAVTAVFPEDGVLAWPSPVAIVEGAKNLENARKFVDWALSDDGQKVLMQASPRVPVTNVETIEGVPALADLNMAGYDYNYWGAERTRVLADFNARYPQYQ